MAKKKPLYGVNTYRERSRKKIGRHKKNMSKGENVAIKNIEDKVDEHKSLYEKSG